MKHPSRICSLALGMSAWFGLPAFADITNEDVWQQLKSYADQSGLRLTASPQTNGNVLSLKGITLSYDSPEIKLLAGVSLQQLDLENMPDGSVRIHLHEYMPLDFYALKGESEIQLGGNIHSAAPYATVTGVPGDLTYALETPSLTVMLDWMSLDNLKLPKITGSLGFAALDARLRHEAGRIHKFTKGINAGTAAATLRVIDADKPGRVSDFRASFSGFQLGAGATIPAGYPSKNAAQMLRLGLWSAMDVSFDEGIVEYLDRRDNDFGKLRTQMSDGKSSLVFSEKGLKYTAQAKTLAADIALNQQPLPLQATLAELVVGLQVPLVKSPQDQTLALQMLAEDAVFSPSIWNRLDAEGHLPQEPATLSLDLSATLKLLTDYLNLKEISPEAFSNHQEMPVQVQEIGVNRLLLSAGGAEIEARGAFAVDNTRFEAGLGIPQFIGTLDLRAAGLNSLIDRLVLVAPDLFGEAEALSLRGVLSAYTTKGTDGTGKESLTTRIEVKEDGTIFANGRRLK